MLLSRLTIAAFSALLLVGLGACKKEPEPLQPVVYTTVRTLAGSGASGAKDGPGATTTFRSPLGMAVDGQGTLYVADTYNRSVRKITPAGEVSTFIRDAALPGTPYPSGLVLDQENNLLLTYIFPSGIYSAKIVKITPSGTVSPFAGTSDRTGVVTWLWPEKQLAASVLFDNVHGIARSPEGVIYVTDIFRAPSSRGNNYVETRIHKITLDGMIRRLVSKGDNVYFSGPYSSLVDAEHIAVDTKGTAYVTDRTGERVWKITSEGEVSLFAGSGVRGFQDGSASTAQFDTPMGITVDALGNAYIADYGNNCIRKITPEGQVSTLAGSRIAGDVDGAVDVAQFCAPTGIALGPDGVLYVSESTSYLYVGQGNRIRTISPQ